MSRGNAAPYLDDFDGPAINAILASFGLTLPDDKFTVTGSADATKTLKYELDGMATGVDLTWTAGAQTADRSLSLPVLTANAVFGMFTALPTAGRVPYVTTNGQLTDSSQLLFGTASGLRIIRTADGDRALEVGDDGDSVDARFVVSNIATGSRLSWGPGVGALDCNLSRSGAAVLSLDARFLIGGPTDDGASKVQVNGDVRLSSGGNYRIVGGDIIFETNAGFGILSADLTRALSIANAAIAIGDALTIEGAGLSRTVGGLAFTATATATVANTVAETSIIGAGVGTKTLPASFLTAGRTIRVRVHGIMSDTGTPTLNIKLKLGSTTIVETGAIALAGAISNNEFGVDVDLVCRSTGVSGTVMATGFFRYDESVHAGTTEGMGVTAAVTVDTTAAQVLDVTATWGTASASNTISGQVATIEILN